MKNPFTLIVGLIAASLAAGGESRLQPFEPANGERLINFHPHFQWRGPEMTADYQPECEIQIAREADFQKLVATDVIGGGMNRFYSMVSLTEPRDYFWGGAPSEAGGRALVGDVQVHGHRAGAAV